MRVCLVSPPYSSAGQSVVGVSSPPLGLAYLASMIRDEQEVRARPKEVRELRALVAVAAKMLKFIWFMPNAYVALRVEEGESLIGFCGISPVCWLWVCWVAGLDKRLS